MRCEYEFQDLRQNQKEEAVLVLNYLLTRGEELRPISDRP
jgi:hypothetical protein